MISRIGETHILKDLHDLISNGIIEKEEMKFFYDIYIAKDKTENSIVFKNFIGRNQIVEQINDRTRSFIYNFIENCCIFSDICGVEGYIQYSKSPELVLLNNPYMDKATICKMIKNGSINLIHIVDAYGYYDDRLVDKISWEFLLYRFQKEISKNKECMDIIMGRNEDVKINLSKNIIDLFGIYDKKLLKKLKK